METKIQHHPVFVSGQYLNSEHLNDTRKFLWQEQQLTRQKIIGRGIVKGMHPTFSGGPIVNNIALSAGAGLTREGYLIENDALVFDKMRVQKMALVSQSEIGSSLMTEEQYKLQQKQFPRANIINATELWPADAAKGTFPDDVVLLKSGNFTTTLLMNQSLLICWLEITDEEGAECEQGSCNSKGIRRHFKPRYFLVSAEDFATHNFFTEQIPTVRTSRIKKLSAVGSLAGFQKTTLDAWKIALSSLLPYFKKNGSRRDLYSISQQLGNEEQIAWKNASTQILQLSSTEHDKQVQQYYIAFADDLAQAINELLEVYHNYMQQHFTMEDNMLSQTLIFGGFNGVTKDAWRYYFQSAHDITEVDHEELLLKKVWLRLCYMIISFTTYAEMQKILKQRNEILAIPDNPMNQLGHRAIPFYYKIDSETQNALHDWNPFLSHPEHIFSYNDKTNPERSNAPNLFSQLANTSWQRSNFFRIEGHLGMTIAAGKALVQKIIVEEGLPVQLLDVSVDYKTSEKWLQWYENFQVFVKNSLTTLRNDPKAKTYAFEPLQKILNEISQISYRDVEQVTKVFNDFYAYHGVFYNSKEKEKGLNKKDLSLKTNLITGDIIQSYKKVLTTQKVLTISDGFYEAKKDLVEQGKQNVLSLKDLPGLEYLGGVYKGGSFVLLHSNSKIVGDGCLPYYFQIPKSRLY